MVIVGVPYSEQRQMTISEMSGGSPYGATTIAGGDGSRQPSANELAIARFQGGMSRPSHRSSSAAADRAAMTDLPTVFVSHGAPTLALDPGETGHRLAALAEAMPRPAAVLVVSAHWDTAAPRVSSMARQRAIHDFHGFPEALYRLDYPAPGAPQLACRLQGLLAESGIAATLDAQRGLDHGAWVPLRMMYPDAGGAGDSAVAAVAAGPAHHYRLGRALSVLRHEGVLIMGSAV